MYIHIQHVPPVAQRRQFMPRSRERTSSAVLSLTPQNSIDGVTCMYLSICFPLDKQDHPHAFLPWHNPSVDLEHRSLFEWHLRKIDHCTPSHNSKCNNYCNIDHNNWHNNYCRILFPLLCNTMSSTIYVFCNNCNSNHPLDF